MRCEQTDAQYSVTRAQVAGEYTIIGRAVGTQTKKWHTTKQHVQAVYMCILCLHPLLLFAMCAVRLVRLHNFGVHRGNDVICKVRITHPAYYNHIKPNVCVSGRGLMSGG